MRSAMLSGALRDSARYGPKSTRRLSRAGTGVPSRRQMAVVRDLAREAHNRRDALDARFFEREGGSVPSPIFGNRSPWREAPLISPPRAVEARASKCPPLFKERARRTRTTSRPTRSPRRPRLDRGGYLGSWSLAMAVVRPDRGPATEPSETWLWRTSADAFPLPALAARSDDGIQDSACNVTSSNISGISLKDGRVVRFRPLSSPWPFAAGQQLAVPQIEVDQLFNVIREAARILASPSSPISSRPLPRRAGELIRPLARLLEAHVSGAFPSDSRRIPPFLDCGSQIPRLDAAWRDPDRQPLAPLIGYPIGRLVPAAKSRSYDA